MMSIFSLGCPIYSGNHCLPALDFMLSKVLFIPYRALGGIADVAAWGAVMSILLKLFPDKVASIISWTQMFMGLGYTIGKT